MQNEITTLKKVEGEVGGKGERLVLPPSVASTFHSKKISYIFSCFFFGFWFRKVVIPTLMMVFSTLR